MNPYQLIEEMGVQLIEMKLFQMFVRQTLLIEVKESLLVIPFYYLISLKLNRFTPP